MKPDFRSPRLTSLLQAVLLAVMLAAAPGVHGQPRPVPEGGDATVVAELRRLPEHELKAFYAHCARAALARALDTGGIALCSVGYEILLQRVFRGDFHALLAWSQGLEGATHSRQGGIRPAGRD